MIRLLIGRPPTEAAAARRALFVDRDGVLNRRAIGGYVTRRDDLIMLSGLWDVLRAANRNGTPVVIVTNQGGVGRGLMTEGALLAVHAALIEALSVQEVRVDAIYACPHHPEAIASVDRHCDCRKPAPGLILQAAADLRLDTGRSALVGDHDSDRAAAEAAGIPVPHTYLTDPEGPAFRPSVLTEALAAVFGWPLERP